MASITGSSLSLATTFKPCLVPGSRVSPVKSVSFNVTRLPSLRRLRVSCAAKPETVNKVSSIVKKQLALPAETLVNGASTFSSLGADSLDTVEIVMGLEEEFGISVEEESAQTITTVQDAADLIEVLVEKKKSA